MACSADKTASAVFRFKRFSVSNSKSGLKVGTDGVLLGASADVDFLADDGTAASSGRGIRVLDIGTGTGLIALMLAQRLSDATDRSGRGGRFHITGIDIDKAAADEACGNFAASPWAENLGGRHCSLEEFERELSSCGKPERFDLIVSNPPYYDNSLKAPDERRNTARHTCSLSYREVVQFAAEYLADGGRVALILPKGEEISLRRYAASFGLFMNRLIQIRTTASKQPGRIVAEFSRMKTDTVVRALTIQDGPGKLTDEFRNLTGEFYL